MAVLMPISLAVAGHQSAAGIAGIDGGVGLDEKLIIIGRALTARQSRDDAHGDGLADAEGIADRQHQVAHLNLVAVAERHGGKLFALGVDLQHRQIGSGVGHQHLGLEFALVVQRHHDIGAARHHMVVGQDHAVGAHDHPGAQRLLHPLAHFRRGAEKLREKGIGKERIDLNLGHRTGIDIDHRRRHPLDHRRESKLHLVHRGGFGFLPGRSGRQPQRLLRRRL